MLGPVTPGAITLLVIREGLFLGVLGSPAAGDGGPHTCHSVLRELSPPGDSIIKDQKDHSINVAFLEIMGNQRTLISLPDGIHSHTTEPWGDHKISFNFTGMLPCRPPDSAITAQVPQMG